MEAIVMRRSRWGSLQAAAIFCAALLGGCVMHSVTREDSSAAGHAIYRISEEEAFITILDIIAIELPNQSVDDVTEGKYRGYNATARFWMDWTDHRVLVIPAEGLDKGGQKVKGYWYDIRSSGSRMIENPLRHNRIREAIQQRLGQAAVVVTHLQDGEYETSGDAYLGRKRDARDIKAERERKTSKGRFLGARGCCGSGSSTIKGSRSLTGGRRPEASSRRPTARHRNVV